jgi:hypothetical protein
MNGRGLNQNVQAEIVELMAVATNERMTMIKKRN